MEPELEMRRQFGLLVMKMEIDRQLSAAQSVGERERNLKRILFSLNLVRRNPVSERSLFACPEICAHIGKEFVPEKTMRAAPDLPSTIEAALVS